MSPACFTTKLRAAILPAAIGAVVLGGMLAARATEPLTPVPEPLAFDIPASDGYGIADCMKSGSECGRVMADSWCEAHGHAKAVAFGSADDITGTILAVNQKVHAAEGDVIIQCGE